jgi:hypothetical protein
MNKPPPQSIQLLISCIGYEATMKLIDSIKPVYNEKHKRYMRQIYVPKLYDMKRKAVRLMVDAIGEHNTKTIVFIFGGESIRIAMWKSRALSMRNALIQQELAKGLPVQAVVQRFGLSRTSIYRVWDSPLIKVLPEGEGERGQGRPAVSFVSGA